MAITIGLDHGHHLRARREVAHTREVPAQRAKMDRGDGGATHWDERRETRGERRKGRKAARPRSLRLSSLVSRLPALLIARRVTFRSMVLELRVLAEEGELHHAG